MIREPAKAERFQLEAKVGQILVTAGGKELSEFVDLLDSAYLKGLLDPSRIYYDSSRRPLGKLGS